MQAFRSHPINASPVPFLSGARLTGSARDGPEGPYGRAHTPRLDGKSGQHRAAGHREREQIERDEPVRGQRHDGHAGAAAQRQGDAVGQRRQAIPTRCNSKR